METLSLPPSFRGGRETEHNKPGSMKNDDAALVKEMKSGLAGREREAEEGWKTERSTGTRRGVAAYVRGVEQRNGG